MIRLFNIGIAERSEYDMRCAAVNDTSTATEGEAMDDDRKTLSFYLYANTQEQWTITLKHKTAAATNRRRYNPTNKQEDANT